jgi:adenylate cyclase
MTIVFWDISSFSVLCNILDKQPILVTGFLRDYLEMAIKCIHDHRGIVDKSIGDGILSFLGFDNEDKKSGAHDAIMAALQLRQKFENIKRKWIEIWSKDLGNTKISLDVKCEINTGAVLFGLLDTDTRSQVTILESPVNQGVKKTYEVISSMIVEKYAAFNSAGLSGISVGKVEEIIPNR